MNLYFFTASEGLFIALCIFLLSSCSKQICRQWEFQEVLTKRPCFNSGRIILGPDTNTSNLELELVRNQSGLRLYINLLLFQASPLRENPNLTKVDILFDDQEVWTVYPNVLEGGQRILLLLPDGTEQLMHALSEGRSFTIKIGRSQLHGYYPR